MFSADVVYRLRIFTGESRYLARWDYVPGELMLSPRCWRRLLSASASASASAFAQCLSFQMCA